MYESNVRMRDWFGYRAGYLMSKRVHHDGHAHVESLICNALYVGQQQLIVDDLLATLTHYIAILGITF